MSVPPQQPGPYGQQPGQFGQQPGQFGQQPGYGQQPGGYPPPPQGFPQGGQQPGYGTPPGGYGQPQQPGPGQQPYGQPGQPGQFNQPGYGQPGGFGDPYGAPPKKSPLPWILGGVGALVVIGVVVVLVMTMGGGSNGTAKDAADSYVAAVNSRDFDKLKTLTCSEKHGTIDDIKKATDPGAFAAELEKQLEDLPPEFKKQVEEAQEAAKSIKVNLTVDKVEETSDTAATATVSVKFSGVPDSMKEYVKDDTDTLPFKKTDDGWVACPNS